jgi:hypothetical protein
VRRTTQIVDVLDAQEPAPERLEDARRGRLARITCREVEPRVVHAGERMHVGAQLSGRGRLAGLHEARERAVLDRESLEEQGGATRIEQRGETDRLRRDAPREPRIGALERRLLFMSSSTESGATRPVAAWRTSVSSDRWKRVPAS